MSATVPALAHPHAVVSPLGTALGAPAAPPREPVAAHRVRARLGQVRSQGLAVSGSRVVAAGGTVCCVWDQATHEIVWRHAEATTIESVAAGSGHVALAVDQRLRVFRLDDGAFVFEARGDAKAVSVGIARSPRVAVSFADGRIELFDLASARRLMVMGHHRNQHHLFIDEDGELLLSQAAHEVAMLHARSGRVIRRYSLTAPPSPTGFARGRPMLAPHGRQVRIFDCGRDNPEPCKVVDFDSPVTSLEDIPLQGTFVASTLDGGIHTVGLWGDRRSSIRGYTKPLWCVRPQRGVLYAAAGEGLIQRIEHGAITGCYTDAPPLVCAAMSPDRRTLLLGDRVGGLTPVALDTRPRVPSTPGAAAVTALACDAMRIAVGSYAGVCTIADWQGETLGTIDLQHGPIQALAFDRRVGALWVGAFDGTLVALDLPRLRPTVALAHSARSVRSIDVAEGAAQLLVGDDSGELCLRDLDAAMQVVDRWALGDAVYRAQFDADTILTCGRPGVLRLRPGQAQPVQVYPIAEVRDFARHRDALYALGLDGRLCRFDVASGRVVARHALSDRRPHRIVQVLNDDRILVGGGSGVVTVFDAGLRPVAELHHQRPGDAPLWLTPPQPEQRHPGWLYAGDSSRWLAVGERRGGDFVPWADDDPRRAAHLMLYDSATHVMAAVTGAPTPPALALAAARFELGAVATARLAAPDAPGSGDGRRLVK